MEAMRRLEAIGFEIESQATSAMIAIVRTIASRAVKAMKAFVRLNLSIRYSGD